MNYHNKQYIMDRMYFHYKELLNHVPEDKIFGVFYYGSGNYGLDTEHSDVDTKAIILPEFDEIVLGKQRLNKKYIVKYAEFEEQLEAKDIRDMIANIKKMNINFVEILFTDYYIINPKYKEFWDRLQENREKIARYDIDLCVKATVGMADEKRHALCLDRPSQHEEIEEHGWSVKQLHHIVRLEDFLYQYCIKENKYESCLKPIFYGSFLKKIKLDGHDLYTKKEAEEVANGFIELIKKLRDDFSAREDRDREKETKNKEEVDKLLYDILKDCLMLTLKEDIEKYE